MAYLNFCFIYLYFVYPAPLLSVGKYERALKIRTEIFTLFPRTGSPSGSTVGSRTVRDKTPRPKYDSSRWEPVFSLLDILAFQYRSFWYAKGFFVRNEPYGSFQGYRPVETDLSSYFERIQSHHTGGNWNSFLKFLQVLEGFVQGDSGQIGTYTFRVSFQTTPFQMKEIGP